MYHVKRILEEMKGDLVVDEQYINGFKIQMRIPVCEK